MTTQTVFRLPSKGAGYEALRAVREPIPSARPHEVILKVHATTLNYRDIAIANGSYPFAAKDDLVPLSDAAGVVVEVGEGVQQLQPGDFAIVNFDISNLYGPQQNRHHCLGSSIDGVLREFIPVPSSAIIPIPKSTTLSWAQLAGLVCTGTTAWNALYGNLPLKPGQTVLFQGTGGVSITGLQIAKAAGAVTIITSSSDAKLKMVKERYGADHVINYKTHANWAEKVNEITGGRGVDFVLETGGSGTIAQSIECIARGGIISVIGFLSRAKEMPDVAALVLEKGCVVRGINIGAKQLAQDMVTFVCQKNIPIAVEKTFGFSKEEVIKAFAYLESGSHVGKIAIRVCG